jgi:sulfoxide reductase heme-binding subunit YedZ
MAFMMLIRGEIGILMASFALSHGVTILSNSFLQEMLLSASFTEMFTKYLALTLGMLALLLTIPLLITSNIYLKEKMGAWWFRLHKLAYGIFILGAVHSVFIREVSASSLIDTLPYLLPYALILIAAKIWGKKK